MIDLKTPEAFHAVLYFVVPGLIAVFIRAQFLSGRMQKQSDAILTYFSISLVYWSALLILGVSPSMLATKSGLTFVAVFVGPAIFGCLLGLNARLDLLRNGLRKIKLNPVHATATAWDWKWSRTKPRFVIVTLTEGEVVAGAYDVNSFSSSDPAERDLFLEKVYDISSDGPWQLVPGKEILIRASEIRYVEFLPMETTRKVTDGE